MTRLRAAQAFFAIALCAPCWAESDVDTPQFLDRPLPHFKVNRGEDELFDLCRALRVGCGFESANDVKTDARTEHIGLAPLSIPDVQTPREILDRLAARKDSKWVFQDGSIDLEPAQMPTHDLLSAKLDSVTFHGISGFDAAVEVFHRAGIPVAYPHPSRPHRHKLIDLELKQVTARQALNAISRADGWMVWVFYPPGSQRTAFFRMVSK